MDPTAMGGLNLVIWFFLFVLGILWFLLPFAIFGTKDRLRELIEETRKTNAELAALRSEIKQLKKSE